MRGIFFRLAIILLGFCSCSRVQESAPHTAGSQSSPDREIWNGEIEIISNGRKQSLVQAGHIESYDKRRITLLDQGVTVDFFDKNGQHTSRLTSQRARIEEKSDIFMAQGHVVVKSDSGAVLRTEKLFWDKKGKRIYSDTLVVFTTQLDSLSGYKFEANEDLSSWRMKNPTGKTFRQVKK